MIYNNATLIKRDILYRTTKALLSGNLDNLNMIPLEEAPRGKENIRWCIHRDRAILRYRVMVALCFRVEDEVDELKQLSDYGSEIYKAENDGLTVIADACSSCRLGGYYISDVCVGCVARPCHKVCPKNAIRIINGRSVINRDLCINCGKCQSVAHIMLL